MAAIQKRRFGRTNLMITELGFGAMNLRDVWRVNRRGWTCFTMYWTRESILSIQPEAIQEPARMGRMWRVRSW